jgi:hypothetical protein
VRCKTEDFHLKDESRSSMMNIGEKRKLYDTFIL